MANDSQPQQSDLVLGGHVHPPTSGAILGGIQGLHQRLEVASPDQKVELLPQSLSYGEAGIDLLVEAVNDAVLIVRATACQLLQKIDSPKAQQAIADGLLLNPGDRIYTVYESYLGYNDCWYYLADSVEEICRAYDGVNSLSEFYNEYQHGLVSQHLSQANAEIAAQVHHQWRALKENISDIGQNESFRLIEWCKTNNVLVRLPGESRSAFEQRINSFYSLQNDLKLGKEQQSIWKEWEKDDYEIDDWWEIQRDLECKVVEILKSSQQYELLGQLWLEAVGCLAFVHEEIVTAPTYVKVVENL
ncbi:MAG: hypothetical protein KME45_22415 [Stenomitos rutilans HA7619-LM2]|jgi:hypothetical protein|nr:hypothetical protein [Stenomitos rutilans HA7619-LM2]